MEVLQLFSTELRIKYIFTKNKPNTQYIRVLGIVMVFKSFVTKGTLISVIATENTVGVHSSRSLRSSLSFLFSC